MMQRDLPPELERLDDGAGPARPLSPREAEACAERVLSELRRTTPRRTYKAWLVAAACLVALGAWASRAALQRRPAPRESHPQAHAPAGAPMPTGVATGTPTPALQPVPDAALEAAAQPIAASAPRDWLKLANAAREQRDYVRARQLYLRAVQASPNSDEAYAANVAAADLEREHLGDPTAALKRYAAVLQARPNGPLSEQAQLGLARGYAAIHDGEHEAAAWRALLKSQPSSWFLGEARARLRTLERAR